MGLFLDLEDIEDFDLEKEFQEIFEAMHQVNNIAYRMSTPRRRKAFCGMFDDAFAEVETGLGRLREYLFNRETPGKS